MANKNPPMVIPPEEFEEGCRFDFENNTFIGSSGTIWHDVTISKEDVIKLLEMQKNDKP